jgi:hypothetical protein
MDSLKTILYFSIFNYPLKQEEIHSYTSHKDKSKTIDELDSLISKKVIYKIDSFYVYNNDFDSVTRRIKGNLQAEKAMLIAKEKAKFISKFPFVKAVGVSGSLSKGYYDSESDIDFFVITEHSKLWICRSLLMFYKKAFLLNSRKFFCINYFISENQLEIEEQNIFTATELKTLIPLQGKLEFEKFYIKNNWINNFFPNFEHQTNSTLTTFKPWFSKMIELIFNSKIGMLLDRLLKSFTLKKWNSKFHYLSSDEFKIALKTSNNISKHHPSNFQKRVIDSLNIKIEEVKLKYQIEIPKEDV